MPLSTVAAGAVGSGAVAALPAFNPPTTPPAPSLPLPPCPADMPDLWDSIKVGCVLGTLQLGPAYGDEARVVVELDSKIVLDKQKSKGKSKSKTKVNGKDDVKGKIKITWTSASWESACRFTMQIDPQGPTGGTPITVDHPELMRRTGSPTLGQSATAQPIKLIITKAGKLTISGPCLYSQEFDFEEWVAPDDKPGTTDTPATTSPYQVGAGAGAQATRPIGSNGNMIGGFGGPNSPAVTP